MPREPAELVFFHGHPSWRSMLGFYVRGLVLAVVVGALAGVLSAGGQNHVRAAWVVAGVAFVFALGLIRGTLRLARTTYTITDRRLSIERGLFSHDLQETSLDRVQNVCARQSLVERLLGVGTVDFDTAGSAEFDFAFVGVEHPRRIARSVERALRDRLLRL